MAQLLIRFFLLRGPKLKIDMKKTFLFISIKNSFPNRSLSSFLKECHIPFDEMYVFIGILPIRAPKIHQHNAPRQIQFDEMFW